MKSILSLLLTVSVIAFGTVAAADTTISRVTNNSYEDSYPRIGDNYLVWQGYVDDDWEVFLYNIATGETTQITDNDYNDVSPQTDGGYIVWHGFEDGEWDIFLWDGSETRAVSDRSAEDLSPEIANGLIVWTSQPFGDDYVGHSEVVLYDAETQTSIVLSANVDPANTLDDTGPRISDEAVIWVQSDDQDNTVTYMYDLSDGTTTESPDHTWTDTSQREGDLTVLTRHDGSDTEIFLCGNNSRTYHQVTDNDLQDRCPTICGSRITWMAGGEIFLAQYQYLALIGPKDNAVLPRNPLPNFTWEGIGYATFNLAFSEDPDFFTGNALTSAQRGASSQSQMSFTPTEEEWEELGKMASTNGRVYWRVEGAGADEDLSETRSFTIEGERGSASIATDTGTDTDTGGDDTCFIDTLTNSVRW